MILGGSLGLVVVRQVGDVWGLAFGVVGVVRTSSLKPGDGRHGSVNLCECSLRADL